MSTHRNLLLLIVILLIAFGLRFLGAPGESLWEDEAASVAYARTPAPDLVTSPIDPGNPPGYYLVLKAWLAVFGEDETLLRLQSILVGLVTVLATFFLGRKVTGRTSVGLVAALLLAMSVCHVLYSQEVRGYAATTLLAVLSTIALLNALSSGRGRYWVLYALSGAAMAWFHYQGLFVLFGQGVASILWLLRAGFPRKRLFHALLAAAAILLFSLPVLWIHLLPSLTDTGVYDSWQPFAEPGDAWLALGRATIGRGWLPDLPVVPTLLSLIAVALPWLLTRLIRGAKPDEHRLPFLAVYYAGAGLFFLVAFLKPVWQDKYLLAFQPLLMIALACGLVRLGAAFRRAPWVPAIAATLLLIPGNIQLKKFPLRPDYRAAVAHVRDLDPDGETPVLVFRFAWYSVRHYLGREVAHQGEAEAYLAELRRLAGKGRVIAVLSESQSYEQVLAIEKRIRETLPVRDRFTANRIRVLDLGPVP